MTKDYLKFAVLHDQPDESGLAFVQKHGALGLNPYDSPVSWEYSGMFLVGGPEPAIGQPDPGLEIYFSRWGNAPPIKGEEVPVIKETPGLIRREARKMHIVIRLWGIVSESTDKAGNFQEKKLFAYEEEVKRLTEELKALWPDISISGLEFPEKQIMIPDFAFLFDTVLLRIHFKVSRNTVRLDKSPFPYKTKGRNLEIKEACLLAKLWYELVFDIMEGKDAPKFCPNCKQLFFPWYAGAGRDYCSPSCQAAAGSKRYRERKAVEEGRTLRPRPGRPRKNIANV